MCAPFPIDGFFPSLSFSFFIRRAEVVLYLRRKVSSTKTKTVFLAVSLAEALVKNCGQRVHAAIGVDYSLSSFMRDMVRAAKRYHGKSSAEAIEVAELLLDVIQAWGEAFLVMRAQYPGFVQAYHDLRKEGPRAGAKAGADAKAGAAAAAAAGAGAGGGQGLLRRRSRLVLIGKGLDVKKLQQGFAACAAVDDDDEELRK